MTEAKIQEHIDAIDTAILNGLKTGFEYEIGTGPSKRITKFPSLKSMTDYQSRLEFQLREVQGLTGSVLQY